MMCSCTRWIPVGRRACRKCSSRSLASMNSAGAGFAATAECVGGGVSGGSTWLVQPRSISS